MKLRLHGVAQVIEHTPRKRWADGFRIVVLSAVVLLEIIEQPLQLPSMVIELRTCGRHP